MRTGLLAALTVLLAGDGLAFAQQYGAYSAGHSWGPAEPPSEWMAGWPTLPPAAAAPVTRGSQPAAEALAAPTPPPTASSPPHTFVHDSVSREPCGDAIAQAKPFGFWVSGEFLLWWFKNGQVPPLVTAGGDGRLGSPGTVAGVCLAEYYTEMKRGCVND
jgi:hypothetical protein